MLRCAVKAGTQLGHQAKSIMDKGGLVSDDLIVGLVKERIASPDCQNGFLFDGFPRTIPQAEAIQSAGINIDAIVEISVSESIIINRITGRRIHMASGRTYHVECNPPKIPNQDDITGDPLIQREDDHEETVIRRLDEYRRLTAVLSDFYRQAANGPLFLRVDGNRSISDVTRDIMVGLSRLPTANDGH
jgi:adenylate kinase